jgi:hypothetical protein
MISPDRVFQSYSLSEDEEVLIENSIVCTAGLVETANGVTEYDGGERCVQVSSHEARLSTSQFWVLVLWVHLPLVSSASSNTQNHHYDRNFSIIQLWVLGFGSAAVETL